jgi:sporulation protein YhbH
MTKPAEPQLSNLAHAHRWYGLFSRGARDWLRHNEKVRDAVREQLPEMIAGADILSRPSSHTVRIPVHFLEHYRFRLNEQNEEAGVGQGSGKPGDVYQQGQGQGQSEGTGQSGQGGSGNGELRFLLELRIEDIVDWIWDELHLPDLKPRTSDALQEEDLVREGWSRHGPRSRLDRRRTLKEAIKRRHALPVGAAPFTDEDLRFRQLARRQRPATDAVVALLLDVSGSMDEERRKLAKSFFFWAVQGLRRQYGNALEIVFIAHTNEAWEFTEEQFFQVTATGGTIASSAFTLALDIFAKRYPTRRYNHYLFYASDGENYADDRDLADRLLCRLGDIVNFMGFVETPQNPHESGLSETGRLFHSLEAREYPVGTYTIHERGDVWNAVRRFFRREAQASDEPET